MDLDDVEYDMVVKAELSSEANWRTFTLTHVDYPDKDLAGRVFAVSSLLPLVVVVIFVTVFAVKRDLHTFCYGFGVILNGCLNYILKHTIKQSRPVSNLEVRDSTKLFEEYGMPSSHSQFMWFVSTYMLFFLHIRLSLGGQNGGTSWIKLSWGLVNILLAVVVSYGRIYLHYHTWEQVAVGAGVGAGMAAFWFGMTHWLLTPWFPWIASMPICRYFLIRDYTNIPNVIWFDYINASKEAKRKQCQ